MLEYEFIALEWMDKKKRVEKFIVRYKSMATTEAIYFLYCDKDLLIAWHIRHEYIK